MGPPLSTAPGARGGGGRGRAPSASPLRGNGPAVGRGAAGPPRREEPGTWPRCCRGPEAGWKGTGRGVALRGEAKPVLSAKNTR